MIFCFPFFFLLLVFLAEPYVFSGRVVQKDSQVFAATTVKRRFLEDTPYLVSGYCQNGSRPSSLHESAQALSLSGVSKLRTQSESFGTMAEKYESMKETLRKRLTFGEQLPLFLATWLTIVFWLLFLM